MAGCGGGCHWAARPDRLQSVLKRRPPIEVVLQLVAGPFHRDSSDQRPLSDALLPFTDAPLNDEPDVSQAAVGSKAAIDRSHLDRNIGTDKAWPRVGLPCTGTIGNFTEPPTQ